MASTWNLKHELAQRKEHTQATGETTHGREHQHRVLIVLLSLFSSFLFSPPPLLFLLLSLLGLLREMLGRGRGSSAGVVLVVDPHTSKILSSCLRMHDLLSAGVLVLQNLCLHREKLQDLPAIYFVEPTEEAFELIIEDFPKTIQTTIPVVEKSTMANALAALHISSAPTPPAAIQPKSRAQYASAHLFFTSPVPASQMKQLQESNIDMKRLKSFVELNMDFVAFESRVFHFDQPHWIPRLYLGDAAEDGPTNATLKPIVQQLMSVLNVALPKGEMPYIRYISDKLNIGKTYISKQLADLVDREYSRQFKAAAAASSSASTAAGSSTAATPAIAFPPPPSLRNTTLLIVDRSLDPLTPLMHEFTFQAMVNDLLKVTGSEIAHLTQVAVAKTPHDSPSSTLTSQSRAELQKQLAEARKGGPVNTANLNGPSKSTDADEGEVVLSEDDALWIEYRHKHIGEVMVGVNRKLKEFASSNKMAQYQHLQHSLASKNGTGKDSVKDVLRAVQEMPEYKAAMRRFTKHVALSQECLDKFKQRSLQIIGELEQCLATNTDLLGKVYTDSRELKEELKRIVCERGLDRSISVLDKLRLVTIYAIVQGGIPDPLLKVLSTSLHPSLLRKVVGRNLEDFGVEIDSFECQLSRARIQELQDRNETQTLALMRYTPSLQAILEGLVENTLSKEQFPYTKSGGRPTKEEEQESSSRISASTSRSATGKKQSSKDGSSSLSPDSRAREKILADAERDQAHRATGRSARRKDRSAESSTSDLNKNVQDEPEEREKIHKLNPSSSSSSASLTSPAVPPHRYIIFMLGGLAFSEMRACYEVVADTGNEVLIGSTAPLTPAEFLLDLSGLTRKQFHEKLAASVQQSQSTAAAAAERQTQSSANASATTSAAPSPLKPNASQPRRVDTSDSDSSGSSDSDASADEPIQPPTKKSANPNTGSVAPSKKKPIITKELVFESEESDGDDDVPPNSKRPTATKSQPPANTRTNRTR